MLGCEVNAIIFAWPNLASNGRSFLLLMMANEEFCLYVMGQASHLALKRKRKKANNQ
jgi:hypothetical protein